MWHTVCDMWCFYHVIYVACGVCGKWILWQVVCMAFWVCGMFNVAMACGVCHMRCV